MAVTPQQCRGARAMLGWSRNRLANEAKIAAGTLIDFERGARKPYERTLADVQKALEAAGIIFIDEDEHAGPGVRLSKHK